MSVYRLEPPEVPRERPPWLITGILLVIVLLMIAAGGLFWLGRYGIALAPTPTLTATSAPPPTATPDFRATNSAADLATQIAYEAVVTRQTPISVHMPFVPTGPLDTSTPHSINLPYITSGPVITPTAVVTSSVAPVVTPENQPATVAVSVPIVVEPGAQSPLATPIPTVEVIPPTDTPTPTVTLITLPTATPTPTYTPAPPPTIVQLSSLKAVVRPTSVFVRGAPSNAITPVGTIVAGTAINLQRRDSTGEWVYFCCAGNELRWMRQVYAPPAANPTVTNLPPSATPDDVRWLATEPWPINVAQPPTATPIPPDDFPHYRHDRANTARVPAAFSGSLVPFWPLPALAAQPFTSAVVVVRQNVVVASADNNLYSFDRNFSNQLWRYTVGQRITQPPLVQENIIYLVDDTGRALALPDTGGAPIWQVALSVPNEAGQPLPVTGFVGAGNRLLIGVNNNGNYRVLQFDRGNGAVLRAFEIGNTPPQALAIGNQLLYVAGAQLWAIDIEDLTEVVWVRDLSGFTAAPVYAANGATALAELYLAGQGGRISLLDANLGIDVRQYDGGNDVVNGLALGDSNIYAYGNGFVKAYDRRSTTLIWRASIAGDVRSVFVTADQLIIVTGGGSIQFVTTTGSSLSIGPSVPASVSNQAAVSGHYLFVPGDDGRLYSFSQ